jgi:hypothetical protein
MTKFILLILSLTILVSPYLNGEPLYNGNLANQFPIIEKPVYDDFTVVNGSILSGFADWSNVIGIAHDVTPMEATLIARNDPQITHFYYITDMILLGSPKGVEGKMWIFFPKDAVFFTGEPSDQQWLHNDRSNVYIHK